MRNPAAPEGPAPDPDPDRESAHEGAAASPPSIPPSMPPSLPPPLPPPAWSDLAAPGSMPTEGLEAELVAHAAWEAVGMARMLDLLAEYDQRDGWARWIGCTSIQQWLSWQCGVGYTAATERLRVARALPALPTIRRLLHEGALSWSKVRALTRIATADDEEVWADLAAKLTAAQLDRLARAQRRITAADVQSQEDRREFATRVEDDGSRLLLLRVPGDEAAPVLAAIDAAAGPPQRGVLASRRRADAAIALLLGRAEVRTEVQVHIEQCPTCERRTAATDDGTPLHPDVADALACDADLVTTHRTTDPVARHTDETDDIARGRDVVHLHGPDIDAACADAVRAAMSPSEIDRLEVGEIDRRRGPNRRQRRWLARRHSMCQFPGCHHDGAFDAHHVIAHGAGGRTRIRNLVRLCRMHHRIVHLAGLVLTLDADHELTVTTPGGRRIDQQVLRQALRVPAPGDPTRLMALGERMDLDACLFAINVIPLRLNPPPAAAA